MLRTILVVMLAAVALAAAACGGANTAAPPSAPAAAPTTAPAAKAQSAAPTTAPAQPTTAPTAAAKANTSTQATVAPTAAAAAKAAAPASAAAGGVTLTLVPDGSEARFLVKEQLAGNNLPNDAVGKTKSLQGKLVVGADGKVDKAQSKITVDVNSLKTDQAMRDGFIKQSTLETGKYPTAEFVPTEIKGLASPLPKSGDVNAQITGDMTVHGTTKPITWDVTGKIDGNTFTGTAKTAVKFGDFSMNPPKVPRVLSLEDNIRLELDFQYTMS